MSIILDTSVWIEYFKGTADYSGTCQGLIEQGEIKTTEIIFAELLQGALNKREAQLIKDYYTLIPKIGIEHLLIAAGEYSRKQNLMSKGIGLIDSVIITATLQSNSTLWTLDKRIKSFLNRKYLFIP